MVDKENGAGPVREVPLKADRPEAEVKKPEASGDAGPVMDVPLKSDQVAPTAEEKAADRADKTGQGGPVRDVPVKDDRQEPPAKEGEGIDNDRYSKSNSDHPRVKKPNKTSTDTQTLV